MTSDPADLLARPPRRVDDRAARAARRLVETVADDVDVAYTSHDSPLGRLLLAATPRGIVRLAYDTDDVDQVLQGISDRISPRILSAPARLDPARRELDQYFAAGRHSFDLDVDWRFVHGFSRRVLRSTTRVPYGEVTTYAEVARSAGSPRATRAAGNALGANWVAIVVPCHRVVRTGGGLGGYGGGLDRKEQLLALESHAAAQ